jgi:uncharacterized protein (TIGR02118 family)
MYSKPDDVEGFEAHYRDTHMPFAGGLSGLERATINRVTGTPRGGEAAFHLVAELRFASIDARDEALRSEAMMDVSRDAMAMCQKFDMKAEILLAEDF